MKKNLLKSSLGALVALVGLALPMQSCQTCSEGDITGEWKVVSINNEAVGQAEVEPFVAFDVEAKTMNGSAGCNRFFGSFELGEKCSFKTSNVGATRMMCPNMEVEDAFLNALNKVTNYSVCGDELTLLDADKNEVLSFEKKETK